MEAVIKRVHWNTHRLKWVIRSQKKDRKNRNYWKNEFYSTNLVLSNVNPHFYRGTQNKVQKGEIEKTPFAFLQGLVFDINDINWENYMFSGYLIFNRDNDQDYVWDSPLGQLIVSPKTGLPEGHLLLLSVDSLGSPLREVFRPF